MKSLTLLIFLLLPILLSAQFQNNYKLQMIKGHWKRNINESVDFPESTATTDRKGISKINEIHINDRLLAVYGEKAIGGNGKSEVVMYHCNYAEINKIELDKYLAGYNIDRDSLGLRPGIVINYQVSCGSFPFKDFIRVNDDTVLIVWNDQVCFYHRK